MRVYVVFVAILCPVFLVINGPAQAGGAPLPFVVCSKLCVRSRL